MANENKEIGEIVKKCKILLLDIEGTTTSISFVKDKLFPYALENVKQFLDSQWDTEDVKSVVTALRKLALEDKEKSVEGVILIPGEDVPKEEQIEGLVNNVKWLMSSDRKAGPLKQLQGLIWKQGYDNGDIKGHVYDDVSPALEQWGSVEGQKVYIYSSGSIDAQKLLFGQSTAGDLLKFIEGHFDTAVGAKQEAASYTSIVEKIGCKSDEILFLTDIVKEAEAARASGLHAALVSRAGNAPLPAGAAAAFPVIHSLEQLTTTNKRKPDDVTQDALPAKVPKTDIEDDVKTTTTETESKVAEAEAAPKKSSEPEPKKEEEKPEKMDVEEPVTVAEPAKEDKIEDVPMEGPVVEGVTDPKEVEKVPVVEAKPIIIEEKTEEKETEKMEAEPVKPVETGKTNGTAEVKNGDVSAPVAEKTPTSIFKIEEITEKQDLAEVDDIIDDLVPIVEEPAAEDMEDLQNVGEVLEKECDEILSKVQDVTNLDNISLKPLLKPIAEETMETENSDTNDIVDRILDSELELEIKQCDEIDLNSVQEITDPKSETVEEKTEKVEVDASDKTNEVAVVEQKATEEVVEDKNVTDGNAASSPTNTETTMEVAKTETAVPETKVSESKEDESMVTEPAEKEVEAAKAPEAESKEVPIAESKEAPQTECKEAPNTESKEAPQIVSEEAPQIVSEEAPQIVTEEAPQIESEEAPKTESKEAPKTESKEAPKTESKEAPKTESKETPQPEIKEAPQAEAPVENKSTPPAEESLEKKENDKVPEVAPEVKDSEMKEPQVNGKTTNGDAETVNVNGDASKAEELNSRLSVKEDGKKAVNGSNGNATEEKGQGDSKEPGAADIKVKSVADVAGAGTDPIEQPTEA